MEIMMMMSGKTFYSRLKLVKSRGNYLRLMLVQKLMMKLRHYGAIQICLLLLL